MRNRSHAKRQLLSDAFRKAEALIDRLEAGVLSLEKMPYRCSERRRGVHANKGYRNLFIENYTVVYRVEEEEKRVIVVTVRYSRSDF